MLLLSWKRADFTVVARCEIHGTATKPGMKTGEKQYMSAFALNEWDSKLAGGVEWRQKIDSQVRTVQCSTAMHHTYDTRSRQEYCCFCYVVCFEILPFFAYCQRSVMKMVHRSVKNKEHGRYILELKQTAARLQ